MTKRPPGSRCAGDVPETRDLGVLGREVHDRIEHEVGEAERAIGPGRREVADRDADRLPARLGAKPRGHRLRQLDPVHLDAAGRQRQGDPPGPDPELERPAAPRELREEVHRRPDDVGSEHRVFALVVRGRDALAEVAVLVVHRPNLPGADGRADSVTENR